MQVEEFQKENAVREQDIQEAQVLLCELRRKLNKKKNIP